jgi:hypothetical protein
MISVISFDFCTPPSPRFPLQGDDCLDGGFPITAILRASGGKAETPVQIDEMALIPQFQEQTVAFRCLVHLAS